MKLQRNVYKDYFGDSWIITESEKVKTVVSVNNDFHMIFDKKTGYTVKWGKTKDEDPPYCILGPEIADIEVTTICHGVRNPEGKRNLCTECYKSNCGNGINMSFDTFKKIFDMYPKTLNQIAFGTDSQATSNPDLWKMMSYCRENGVVPNLTIADISDDTADKIANYCGAVAVSFYPYTDKNRCYDSVKKLTDRGMSQVNIHACIHDKNIDSIMELLNDRLTDNRLKGMNAIVFLSLKQKGRGVSFNPMLVEDYKKIIDFCFDKNIPIGFDSCGASKFVKAIKGMPDYDKLYEMVEPCESTMFSSYFSAEGVFYPCSFCEKAFDWKTGIHIDDVQCFDDIWCNERTVKFRNMNISSKDENGCATCPYYNV